MRSRPSATHTSRVFASWQERQHGNLQIFQEPDHINGYAVFLRQLGPTLWIARIVIIASALFSSLGMLLLASDFSGSAAKRSSAGSRAQANLALLRRAVAPPVRYFGALRFGERRSHDNIARPS